MAELPIFIVDAFADGPFKGNPAAVCLLPAERDNTWLQGVGGEMNLSETAFLVEREDGYGLRWFTPVLEVDLCGHATLASAHVLWQTGRLDPKEPARFHTRSGPLSASRIGDWIALNFPREAAEPAPAPDALKSAIGIDPVWVGRNRMDYLVQLSSEAELRELTPNLEAVKHLGTRGLLVTARPDGGEYDYVSRYFAPQYGVDEDPVTGSTHCALAPFWTERLGRPSLVGYQASKRGGIVRTTVMDDRVVLCGRATTIMEGSLLA
jgi:PhzF family phenazine biosynthesis protein